MNRTLILEYDSCMTKITVPCVAKKQQLLQENHFMSSNCHIQASKSPPC
jgi:hypothetical protein